MSKLDRWSDYIPADELDAYRKGAFGNAIGFGERPALLNVDSTFMFVDPAYALCGAEDPALLSALGATTDLFRELELPIYYSRRDDRAHPTRRGIWNYKLGSSGEFQYRADPRADQWPASYAPRERDVIVDKNKPSPFFETPLESWLRYDAVDTVVICGVSTSGCVRAAAVDAFSHNFRVIVVEDACGDRSNTAHIASLFDMDMKYADVESLAAVEAVLRKRYG
jgi:nicotinamidase-related amidase